MQIVEQALGALLLLHAITTTIHHQQPMLAQEILFLLVLLRCRLQPANCDIERQVTEYL
jgi:hypothetical protein